MPATIEQAARELARANALSEDSMVRIYWFPHEKEVRLVEVLEQTPPTHGGTVLPYFFGPSSDYPFDLGIALVRPEEEQRDRLPAEWGTWTDGVVVYQRNGGANGH